MIKKLIVGGLIAVVVGAIGVGAYDAYQGDSTLSLPEVSLSQAAQNQEQGQRQGQQGQGQGQGQQGQGQGNGQGQGQQGRGRGQGQGQAGGQGNGSGQPQAMEQDWVTLTGTVVSFDQRRLVIDTVEEGELSVQLGPPGFAGEQQVAFEAGDAVTMWGFAGENGAFQAGQITNENTGQKLLLRDPNGRPLWAGRGQGQGHQ